MRLDVFLAQQLTEIPSRTFIQKMIEAGQVKVNQKAVKAHYKVVTGDEIRVEVPATDDSFGNIKPENIPLDIFYEDQWLIVVNKPAGMLVHPAQGSRSGTLVNALLHHYQTLSDVNASFRPGIVHRLDRETSGLMLVAKDNVTHVRLARQFEKHRIQKQYLALVAGHVKFDEGVIDAPLGRHHIFWDKRGVSFEEEAKDAKTFYRVLKRFAKPVTLVALFPESGRTHQLRVHMTFLGHPILGDDKYGDKNSFPRLALHAQGIRFLHPQTQCEIEFFSVAPKEFLSP